MYGWRARIGFICPSQTGESFLHEFPMVAPEGVSLMLTTMKIQALTRDNIGASLATVQQVTGELAANHADIAILGGSPTITYGGFGFDQEIIRQMKEAAPNIPCTTSQTGAVLALRRLGAKKVAIASPFSDHQNDLLKKFLEDSGFQVPSTKGLDVPIQGLGGMASYASYRVAKDAFNQAPDVDAVYMPCAQMPTFKNIAQLESDLGVPVISSFQAMLWHVFEMLNIRDPKPGYGSLFDTLKHPQK